MGPVPMIYLDHAATTPLSPEVRAAIEPFLGESFGNPSSRHPLGVEAARAIERAREQIAFALGALDPERIYFTAGGTEANNLGVLGAARTRKRKGRHLLLGPTEHPSVRAAVQALESSGFEKEMLALRPGGALDLERAKQSLRNDTVLVAQMAVNNEFGSRYPIEELSELVRRNAPNAHLHVDAVQAIGKIPLSLLELNPDSLALSGHKLHGLKGAGALVLREEVRLTPLVFGGGQEGDVRPGTENVVGIVALGAAVESAVRVVEGTHGRLGDLRKKLAAELSALPGCELLAPDGGGPGGLSPAIAAVRMPGPPAEVWMHHLEQLGVYTSVGSACQSRTKRVSPGLSALGLDERSGRQVLRFSFSTTTSADEIRGAGAALFRVAGELRVRVS